MTFIGVWSLIPAKRNQNYSILSRKNRQITGSKSGQNLLHRNVRLRDSGEVCSTKILTKATKATRWFR